MTTKPATIVYPETDGMPLPDGAYQAPLYYKVNSELDIPFKDDPYNVVNGNTFIYYVEGDPRRSVAPDCFVIFDVPDEKVRFWYCESERWLLSHEEEQAGRLEAEARVAELEAEIRRLRGE